MGEAAGFFGWFVGLPAKVKTGINTAEFAASFACACVAWSLGGDMVLTGIALFTGWLLGSVGIATVPSKPGGWKFSGIVLLFLCFAIEGGFLYWHFHEADARTILARWIKTVPALPQNPASPPTPVTPPKQQLVSTIGHMIFKCPLPASIWLSVKEKKAMNDRFRRNIVIVGKAIGASITLTEIPDGLRFEVEPNDAMVQWGTANRLVVEAKPLIGDEKTKSGSLLVTADIEQAPLLDAISRLIHLPIEQEPAKTTSKQIQDALQGMIESIFGLPKNECQLI